MNGVTRWLHGVCLLVCFVLGSGWVAAQELVGASNPELGFQKRHGDEIMVCGQLYRIGTPVVLWMDQGGFDAYRTTRRFAPFDKRDWKSTAEEMQAGKLDFVTKPQEFSPDRYGLRFGSTASESFTGKTLRPRLGEPVVGKTRDVAYVQYDYTLQQYEALIKLSAALCDIFPKLKPEMPRMPDGKPMDRTLTDEQWASFSGILGHYHVQGNKSDPGPALDWEVVLQGVREQMGRIRGVRGE